MSGLLRQDGFNPGHLIRQHGLHLFRLHIQLHHHLLLESLNLGCVLGMVVRDSCFQRRLAMCQLLDLLLKQLHSLVMAVNFHLVRQNWELRQDFGLDPLLKFLKSTCSWLWSSWRLRHHGG